MAESVKVVAKNSKAYHDYFIEEKYEAGIELAGTEVKSIRMGNVSSKMVSFRYLGCISAHMKRATFLIKSPAVPAGC